MRCPDCRCQQTRVLEVAQSCRMYTRGKGKSYLKIWGRRLKKSKIFTARIRECSGCKKRFRTIEHPESIETV